MTQILKPRDYQQAIMQFIADHERCNIWAGMGTGKTVSTLTALQGISLVDDPFPALVIAPLRVASSTWPTEAEKWAHLQKLRIRAATGDESQRMHLVHGRVSDIVTINYDKLVWLVDHLGDLWPFKTVVADEATRLKGFRVKQGGKRAQALGKVAHKRVQRWLNLTGTPAPNGYNDLWGQQWFVDAGHRLGRSFDAFEKRWFAWKRMDPLNPHQKTKFLMDGAEDEINSFLRDCTITVRAQDFLDLPPLIENVIEVDLPPTAARHYRELQKEMFTVLAGGHEVEAFNAAAKTQKCLQAAAGAIYKNPDVEGDTDSRSREWVEIHDVKIDALRSIIAEANGMPVLVAYHFISDLARLKKAFPEGRHLDANPQTIFDWNAGRIPLMFAHPQSAGHGLNLQDGGNILAYFTSWWNLEYDQQILERIGPTRQTQSGYNRPVFVHRIVARGTVDQLVLRRLQTKASVQQVLLEAMKGQT